ncbi:sigma-54 dependent transcriptional regulator [Deferribacterales bacterium Es71-Z0220]|uniref:sigma-54-dependent transcriptional regulator n=1 Tax=Deferrivibrio essentukiensis TaxID=2880922 RepID=UPI001F616164|nr:sigma-54 dependent transcriptional regulator [Deferrivibrio essentukiensis]MCB4204216.1 sigma-54 dependent transcriptional regulator [Deferrivibrio essentukiensis]
MRVLILDDEESILWVLKEGLSDKSTEVLTCETSQEAVGILNDYSIDVCLVDIFLNNENGIELVEKWSKIYNDTTFLIMTAQNSGSNIINSMKAGAIDFVSKPFDLKELKDKINEIISDKGNKKVVSFEDEYDFQTHNKKMVDIYKTIGKIAKTDINVLIQGETGTGKEVIAKMIHEKSSRSGKPFVAINMAAIPKELMESELFGYSRGAFTGAVGDKPGKFEEANGGTIFLDEISEAEMAIQSKLLRVLQEKEVTRLGSNKTTKLDIRVIVATNDDLEELVREKRFREDLYYRLNVVTISLPSLRERKEDIPVLVNHFLKKYASLGEKDISISTDAMEVLVKYNWPGNIRELENVIQYSIVHSSGKTLTKHNLPNKVFEINGKNGKDSLSKQLKNLAAEIISSETISESFNSYEEYLKIVEKPLIKAALEKTLNNKSEASKILGINRNTLRKKIKDLNIE